MRGHSSLATRGHGFTLLELLITLAIVATLVALMMPALSKVRETADRMTCASNQYQIGAALGLYAKDHRDQLPPSYFGSPSVNMPQEMMTVTTGVLAAVPNNWEGLGILTQQAQCYLGDHRCLYCPSHRGTHSMESEVGAGALMLTASRIYMNYHYRGDYDLTEQRHRRIDQPHDYIFLTDGLRTQEDFNHGNGGNRLHGDLGVSWWTDGATFPVMEQLPAGELSPPAQAAFYQSIWQQIVVAE